MKPTYQAACYMHRVHRLLIDAVRHKPKHCFDRHAVAEQVRQNRAAWSASLAPA